MAAGKDLKTVAADIGVSEQTLRQMGGERSKQPNPDRLISAAESTGAPVEWLVAGWEAVVLRSSLPVDLQERADEDALLARISETVDGLADEVSKMRRGQALLADRVRALERGGRA